MQNSTLKLVSVDEQTGLILTSSSTNPKDTSRHLQESILQHAEVYKGTILPVKSDSDVMFCLQSYLGLRIDGSLVY